MPAISFSNLNTNLNPTPAWRFYCTLPTVSGTVLNGQQLSFYIERCSIPLPGINFEAAAFNSGERQFPNLRTIDIINMVLMEDTNYSVIQYLRAWKNLIIDDQGNYGLPSTYMLPIQLQPYDFTGNSNITLSWPNCAPSRIDSLDFDGTASKHVTCAVAFITNIMDPFTASSNATPPAILPSNVASNGQVGGLGGL
jgi:hypothetical protein